MTNTCPCIVDLTIHFCSRDYNKYNGKHLHSLSSPLQWIAVVWLPKQDIIVMQVLYFRLIILKPPTNSVLLCCCVCSQHSELFIRWKAKNGKHNNENTNKQSLAYSVPVFCLSVCIFTSYCSYGRYCMLSACSLVCWHYVLQYIYHNSTMLLLSQIASASGGLFSAWDYKEHPTHPEGIWKINPHLSNWMYLIWFDKHQPYRDVFFINTWQCALCLRPEEM